MTRVQRLETIRETKSTQMDNSVRDTGIYKNWHNFLIWHSWIRKVLGLETIEAVLLNPKVRKLIH